MVYEIESYVGTEDILFGMLKEEIRDTIGSDFKEFKKANFALSHTDAFTGLGLHVHYDNEGKCEAIEFAYPSDVRFNGIKLLGNSFELVLNEIRKTDSNIEIDESGFISYKHGIGIYVPTLKDIRHQEIQGVIIFRRGYYDS